MEIELSNQHDTTDAGFSMTMTALNDEGVRILAGSALEGMKQMMAFLAASLKHYCETGRMMKIT